MIINPANLAELQIELDAAWNAALKAAGTPGENSMADALLYRKIAHGKKKVEYPWRTTQLDPVTPLNETPSWLASQTTNAESLGAPDQFSFSGKSKALPAITAR